MLEGQIGLCCLCIFARKDNTDYSYLKFSSLAESAFGRLGMRVVLTVQDDMVTKSLDSVSSQKNIVH